MKRIAKKTNTRVNDKLVNAKNLETKQSRKRPRSVDRLFRARRTNNDRNAKLDKRIHTPGRRVKYSCIII